MNCYLIVAIQEVCLTQICLKVIPNVTSPFPSHLMIVKSRSYWIHPSSIISLQSKHHPTEPSWSLGRARNYSNPHSNTSSIHLHQQQSTSFQVIANQDSKSHTISLVSLVRRLPLPSKPRLHHQSPGLLLAVERKASRIGKCWLVD